MTEEEGAANKKEEAEAAAAAKKGDSFASVVGAAVAKTKEEEAAAAKETEAETKEVAPGAGESIRKLSAAGAAESLNRGPGWQLRVGIICAQHRYTRALTYF